MTDGFNQTRFLHPNFGSTASGCLTIFDGNNEPIELNLTSFGKSTITFGRDPGCDIKLSSRYVSHKHGRIRIAGSRWVIEDIDSTNGLIFNGKAFKRHILVDGDSIRIDDGVETTTCGVLMVFSAKSSSTSYDTGWKTIDLSKRALTTIGRDRACDVVLDHVSVSKVHAKIIAIGDAFFIIDSNSTNGIVVNGQKVDGKVLLHEKDVILITNSKLIFGGGKLSYFCFKDGIDVVAKGIVKKVGKGKKTICNNVSLHIEPGELVAIVGGSGAGKTTFMNCISGYSLPTEGSVYVNGIGLYENINVFKSIIGYVPQSNIVFDDLSVIDMLNYAADLRLPVDLDKVERQQAIDRAINTVELTEYKEEFIRNLSGGQKKRASISVELLSDPNLFFLDEPVSGLDPGIERNLMKTLRQMATGGKTVIFVTHSTLNLGLCDKIAFIGTGGNLCFYGDCQDALEFFAVDDVVDAFNLIAGDPLTYKEKFSKTQGPVVLSTIQRSTLAKKQFSRRVWLRQVRVLSKRHLHLMLNDRIRLLLILLQAPLLAVLISLVADGEQFKQYEMTKSLLFALSCSAYWIGTLNSIQEICKERAILKREYMTGLRLGSYIVSKTAVMALVCVIQAFFLTTVFALLVGLPSTGVIFGAYPELILVTFLTALAASATGLFVSSLFKNADRAMTIAPLLLMPQLLFSGLIFKLDGASKIISWIAACRFSVEAYGSTADLNSLPLRLQQQGFQVVHDIEDFFTHTPTHFLSAVLMLCVFVVVFTFAAWFVSHGIKREEK